MPEPALRVALLGAESTGKTTLAAALAACLAADTGLRATWVPELLRSWCERTGRTPRADEQAALLRAQHALMDEAAALHDVVVCDTTALQTAVYSRMVFGDRSLDAEAVALHRTMDLTLLTALDLPWVSDGLQRDGPHVREPVDAALRELLQAHGLAYAVVGGEGEVRLQRARDAIVPRLRTRMAPGARLFSDLAARDAADAQARLRPACECCGVPECEQALVTRR